MVEMVETCSVDEATVRAWFDEKKMLHIAFMEREREEIRLSLTAYATRQMHRVFDAAVKALDAEEAFTFDLRSFCVESDMRG